VKGEVEQTLQPAHPLFYSVLPEYKFFAHFQKYSEKGYEVTISKLMVYLQNKKKNVIKYNN
jgi:hypothetical protein